MITGIQETVRTGVQKFFSQEVKLDQVPAVQFQKTKKEFDGDLTIVVFPYTRLLGCKPEEAGERLGSYLVKTLEYVEDFNVIKGFLNLVVADRYWLEFLDSIITEEQFGLPATPAGKTVMVEYSSPNTNKPLHLGHLRNNFLGNAVARILDMQGNKVVKVQIINDRGIHICKSMVAWLRFGEGETPEFTGIKGDKLVGNYYVKFDRQYKQEIAELVADGMDEEAAKKQAPILLEAQEMLRKWEQGDAEVRKLWERMNGWVYDGFDVTYNRMGVDFDKLYYESDTYLLGRDIVKKGLEDGIFYKKEDGSIWADMESEGLDQKLLLRADGTAVYMTQDIGTAVLRYQDYPDLSQVVYTVGNEQDYHFKVLFTLLDKLGYKWAKSCYHLSYGMVDLPSGKMKSREGTVVDADDLMAEMAETARSIASEHGKLEDIPEEEREELYDMIGVGALKYFLLKVDPKKRLLFDPMESIDFNGHTGPFIQYTHARIRSIVRKAGELPAQVNTDISIEPAERLLIKKLYDFPQALREAGEQFSPAVLANYAFELVKVFNSFYQSTPILKEENRILGNYKLVLTAITGRVVNRSMNALGIRVPDRM